MNKINYQKELEHLIDKLPGSSPAAVFAQLLCAVLQLLSGIFAAVFRRDGILLQSKHQLFGGIPASGGGIKTSGEHAE